MNVPAKRNKSTSYLDKSSQINAVQSGMMGATDKVYLVELGKQALMKDIAYIWDFADIEEFPNTEQQKEFFERWTKSLVRELY